MSHYSPGRKLATEFAGSALLLATIVGSGIMAQSLAEGNVAIALLANALATGAMLVVLITMFGPISGAHFNPAVTLVFALKKALPLREAALYCVAQLAGAFCGVLLAHVMFDLEILQTSTKIRSSTGQIVSEAVASFGLLLTILATLKVRESAVAVSVGLYITAAYWFTASTSFANPAVTMARAFSDSFAGIRPQDVAPFIAAQIAGALLAMVFAHWQTRDENRR